MHSAVSALVLEDTNLCCTFADDLNGGQTASSQFRLQDDASCAPQTAAGRGGSRAGRASRCGRRCGACSWAVGREPAALSDTTGAREPGMRAMRMHNLPLRHSRIASQRNHTCLLTPWCMNQAAVFLMASDNVPAGYRKAHALQHCRGPQARAAGSDHWRIPRSSRIQSNCPGNRCASLLFYIITYVQCPVTIALLRLTDFNVQAYAPLCIQVSMTGMPMCAPRPCASAARRRLSCGARRRLQQQTPALHYAGCWRRSARGTSACSSCYSVGCVEHCCICASCVCA